MSKDQCKPISVLTDIQHLACMTEVRRKEYGKPLLSRKRYAGRCEVRIVL